MFRRPTADPPTTAHTPPTRARCAGPALAARAGLAGRTRRTGLAGLLGMLVGSLACTQSLAGTAVGEPRWEAGIAGGLGWLPDYPGADRARWRGIALPYLVYRGPVLRIDQQGVRGLFVDTPDWAFALTATGAFDARDNDRRAGMPRLDYLFGVGPQWIYKGWAQRAGGPTLHLKLRALASTDFSRLDGRGFSAAPELRWRFERLGGSALALTLAVEPTWASRDLHRFFYEVTPEQAMPGRPAWRARSGYLGTEFAATLGGRATPTLSWFVRAQASSLHGAANTGSPLLARRGHAAVGAGFAWTPLRSAH